MNYHFSTERAKILAIEKSRPSNSCRTLKITLEVIKTGEIFSLNWGNFPTLFTSEKMYGNKAPAAFEEVWEKAKENDVCWLHHATDDTYSYLTL